MANNLQRNPWYLDTASNNYLRSGTTTPAGVNPNPQPGNPGGGTTLNKGPIGIQSIQWTGYTTTTHTAVFVDANGNTIWSFTGKSDKSPVEINFRRPFWVWDLALTTLGSGFVAINLA